MRVFRDTRRSLDRLVESALGTILAFASIAMPAAAQSDPNLTNEQRWKILDCYTDMAWDSSACRNAGVTKRGKFFYGPLGTNDQQDPAFNPELDELLVDCRGVNDGYCANEDSAPVEPSKQTKTPDTAPRNRWLAQSRETQKGVLCTVGIKQGNTVVGFTAMNSREYRGFFVGLIDKATRATWRVDDTQPFVVDGTRSASGGWLTEPLRPDVLTSAANGKELAVTSADGERIVVSLVGARDAIASFDICRRSSGTIVNDQQALEVGRHSPADVPTGASGSHFTCAFRMSEVDGVEVPRGMMSDRAYLRTFEVTRISITFSLDDRLFIIGDRKVEGAEFAQPSAQLPDGAVTMPFSSFYTAVALVSASGATRGLSAEHQAEFQDFMKKFSGASAQSAVPDRQVVFNPQGSGDLVFFDIQPSNQPVNFSSADCMKF